MLIFTFPAWFKKYRTVDARLHYTVVTLSSLATDPGARENPEAIKEILNFESGFASKANSNVFPLLAVHDRLIRYERQKTSYGDVAVKEIGKGHTTGALAYRNLRDHVLKHLN